MLRYRSLAAGAAMAFTILAGQAPGHANTPSIVVDAGTGTVLHAEAPLRPWFPASLTKVMTLYLVFQAIEDGRLSLSQRVPVSKHAATRPPTKLGLKQGREITVETAIKAVITRSANDAAVVLAEAVAGTEAAFATSMNETARALGMTGSRFRNASGLPDPEQVTTARDMAILARALLADFPARYELFSARSMTYGGRRLSTTNGWLTNYRGAEGLKTGFTCASGYNLVGAAARGERRLIGVVLGDRSRGSRSSRMTELMNASFARAGGTLTDAQSLASLDHGAAAAPIKPPPHIFSPADCGTVVTARPGRLSGWGVIFGSFHSKTEARKIIKQNRAQLRAVVAGGRAAIVPSRREAIDRHSALLVGLKQADAAKACRLLWDRGGYCLALSPQVLNDPQAIWR